MSVQCSFRCRARGIPLYHRPASPSGDLHKVAFGAAAGEPAVREGVSEGVRVYTIAYPSRYDSPGACLSVADDDSASISASFGEENMDRAVIAVGQALDKCLRACDVVGRVAPDQFGVILSNCLIDGVQVIVERILNAVMRASVRMGSYPG